MLFGEYGAGTHYRGLFAAKHTEVCRAQRDFRLAVAHIAAQQPVHYLVGAHIGFDFGYGAELVGSFFILEGILELLHHDSVFGEAVALLFAPLGIQLLQVERHLFYRLSHALLYSLELRTAYLGERGIVLPDILGEDIHLLHGHVQHVAALVFNGDVFLNPVGRLYLLRARYLAYAVLFVYCVLSYLGRGEHIAALAAYALGLRRLRVHIAAA